MDGCLYLEAGVFCYLGILNSYSRSVNLQMPLPLSKANWSWCILFVGQRGQRCLMTKPESLKAWRERSVELNCLSPTAAKRRVRGIAVDSGCLEASAYLCLGYLRNKWACRCMVSVLRVYGSPLRRWQNQWLHPMQEPVSLAVLVSVNPSTSFDKL